MPRTTNQARDSAHRTMGRILLALFFASTTMCGKHNDRAAGEHAPIGAPELKAILAESRGRIVVLYFWATWCKSCMPELRSLSGLQVRHGDQKVRVICVSIDPPGDPMRTALVRFSYQEAGPLYGGYISRNPHPREIMTVVDQDWLEVVPITYLIGRDGQVARRLVGSRAMRDLENQITALR